MSPHTLTTSLLLLVVTTIGASVSGEEMRGRHGGVPGEESLIGLDGNTPEEPAAASGATLGAPLSPALAATFAKAETFLKSVPAPRTEAERERLRQVLGELSAAVSAGATVPPRIEAALERLAGDMGLARDGADTESLTGAERTDASTSLLSSPKEAKAATMNRLAALTVGASATSYDPLTGNVSAKPSKRALVDNAGLTNSTNGKPEVTGKTVSLTDRLKKSFKRAITAPRRLLAKLPLPGLGSARADRFTEASLVPAQIGTGWEDAPPITPVPGEPARTVLASEDIMLIDIAGFGFFLFFPWALLALLSRRRARPNAAIAALLLLAFAPGAHAADDTVYDIVAAAGWGGNGEVISGGDPRLERLADMRARLNRAYRLVDSGAGTTALCEPRQCRAEAADLCRTLQSLTPPQQRECRAFLSETAKRALALNEERATPMRLSTMPLHIAQPNGGGMSQVMAVTRREATGPIIFHDGSLQGLGDLQLAALMAHEIGHKTPWQGKEIDDFTPVGSFKNGRTLLDAAGAALAFFSPDLKVPSQQAPPLPEKIRNAAACPALNGPIEEFLAGLAADTEGTMPAAADLSERRSRLAGQIASGDRAAALAGAANAALAAEATRRERIASMFRSTLHRAPTFEETNLFLARLKSGRSPEMILASIVGDMEFSSANGADNDVRFLAAAFSLFLGRQPAASETQIHLPELGAVGRATWVLRLLKHSREAIARQVKDAFVRYLNRPPSAEELEGAIASWKSGTASEGLETRLLSSEEYAALQEKRWTACKRAELQATDRSAVSASR